jgi:hypothetical protein
MFKSDQGLIWLVAVTLGEIPSAVGFDSRLRLAGCIISDPLCQIFINLNLNGENGYTLK